jgi:prepilin-type processing-associated H-X9-DG protein
VTDADARKSWMGTNGGIGNTLFADGRLAGIWRPVDGKVEIDRLHRDLTKGEKSELDEEVARVEALLAR